MKILFIIIIVVLVIAFLFIGHSDWHLNRNQHHELPTGDLTHKSGDIFLDKAGLEWEKQPAIKNKFHQPKEPVQAPDKPYPNVNGDLDFDPNNPNLKFLCELSNGGSYELIVQANGDYLTTGPLKGTYNYGHPSGLWGSIKHVVLDVLPHFVSGDYK